MARIAKPLRLTKHPTLLGMLGLLVIAATGSQHPAWADDAPAERLPVPKSAAQSPIDYSIRSQYRQELASRDPATQLELARSFQKQAAETGVDPTRQYVLLREARELATNAGDFDVAFSIIDDTARLFTVDPDELKITVLANSMDRALIPKPQLLDNYLKVGQSALEHGNVQMAYQVSVLADQVSGALHDAGLSQRVREYDLRVHAARREYQSIIAAANKLRAKPDDAEANLLVGRYLCFMQGHWDEGLPMLAHGSDSKLKEIASRDVDGPDTPEAMADLADAYWDLPDTRQTPQRASHQRAAHWYEQAVSKLKEPRKTMAQQRIDAQAQEPK